MTDRVRKKGTKKSSTERRRKLAFLAASIGTKMPRCSYCRNNNLECRVPESSTNCGSCLRANRRHCNVDGIDPAVVRSLLQQKAKLDAERDATIAQLGQASAKLARLEAQTRALQERALILIEEEDKTIAELEAEEAAEAAAAADVPPSPSVDLPSWESFFGRVLLTTSR